MIQKSEETPWNIRITLKNLYVISHLLLLWKIVILYDSKLNAGWISYFNIVVCKVLS